jgi:hypothetical protein
MKQIDNYIQEKLHINKDSKYKQSEQEKVIAYLNRWFHDAVALNENEDFTIHTTIEKDHLKSGDKIDIYYRFFDNVSKNRLDLIERNIAGIFKRMKNETGYDYYKSTHFDGKENWIDFCNTII